MSSRPVRPVVHIVYPTGYPNDFITDNLWLRPVIKVTGTFYPMTKVV